MISAGIADRGVPAGRTEEFAANLELLRRFMGSAGLDCMVLSDHANVAWLAGGGRSFVGWATDQGAARVVVTPSQVALVTTNIEARRMAAEEFPNLPWQVIEHPWWESPAPVLARLIPRGGRVGVDGPIPWVEGTVGVGAEIARLRTLLTPQAQDRVRALGKAVGEVMAGVCRELPKMFEEVGRGTVPGARAPSAAPTSPGAPGPPAEGVREFFPKDAITVMDGGNTSLWVTAFNPIYTPRSYLYTAKFGHLGTGLPYAIGAKLAAPERAVYLISGDGAFGFNLQEMETASRHNVLITAVVLCDRGWGMERSSQMFAGIEDMVECDLYGGVRLDLVAQGFGWHGEVVERLEDLRPALERGAASGRPSLIQVMVEPMANLMPPGLLLFGEIRRGD